MDKKNLILLIVAGIMLLVIISCGIYYFFNRDLSTINELSSSDNDSGKVVETKVESPEEYWEQANKDNPDILIGTLSFQSGDKATLQTTDGKTYTFTPNQPEAVYGSFGVRAGDKVKVQAKILDGNTIKWVKIELIK